MTGDRLTVLVVEDDEDLVLVMRHELTLAGHNVLVAETAENAVSQASDADLVLLDFHLPGADGLDLMRRIMDLHDPPSVVMVTGDDLGGLDEAAMQAGAVDFVPKRPGYLRALPGIVQRAARQHDLAKRAQAFEGVALSLLTVESREEAVAEILHGACRMLQVSSAALVTGTVGDLRLEMQVGAADQLVATLQQVPANGLPMPGMAMALGADGLMVCLPETASNERVLLLVGPGTSRADSREDRSLAEAYARVAATALHASRRRVDQRELVDKLHLAARHTFETHHRALSTVREHLEQAGTEVGRVLDQAELDREVLRALSRAEAHLDGARRAVVELESPPDEG